MVYCRWVNGSDVYVFIHSNGFFKCCHDVAYLSNFDMRNDFDTIDPIKMISHLNEHKQMGHLVPDRVMDTLKNDQKKIKKQILSLRKKLI